MRCGLEARAGKPSGTPERRGRERTSRSAWEAATEARAGGDPPLEGVATANPVVPGNPCRVRRWKPRAVGGRVWPPCGEGAPEDARGSAVVTLLEGAAQRSAAQRGPRGLAAGSANCSALGRLLAVGCSFWGSRRSVKTEQAKKSLSKARRLRSFSSRAFATSHF